jgi:hypothetical protein
MELDPAKIQFSREELLLASDAALILTKNRIMKKVVQQFASLSASYQWIVDAAKLELPTAITQTEPRISRGEQYHELPWVMLDYPRIFGKEEIFAIRTMFWWGHEYSITLHLRGDLLSRFRPALENAILEGKLAGFLVSGVADEWMHHREADSHFETDGMDIGKLKTLLHQRSFLKLRRGFPLTDWPEAEANLRSAFTVLIQVFLAVSSQGGERVP